MPPRKERIPVVFDTNIVVAHYLSRSGRSASSKLFRLWRVERRLQLIVSRRIVDEYMEILERVGIDESLVRTFAVTLAAEPTVTIVNFGRQPRISSDPDDDVFVHTADASRARFIVSHDPHLLNIPAAQMRSFKFRIVRAREMLTELDT